MADGVTVRVIKLEDHFAAALAAASGRTLIRAVVAGGFVVEAYAKINASRGRPGLNVVTGNLVNSIVVRATKREETAAEVDVGPTAVYGRIHELGGMIHQTNAWGKGIVQDIHIPARPYLRPAVDEHLSDIGDAIGAVLKGDLEAATR